MLVPRIIWPLIPVALLAAPGSLAFPAEPASRETATEGERFFESRIRPVLVHHCYGCHSAEAETLHGGLRLDFREGVRLGGDSGAALVPGQPGESLLLEALRYESFEMPPEGKLPDAVIADFERWIRMGAPDPRAAAPDGAQDSAAAPTIDFEAARRHWAFQPIGSPAPPGARAVEWAATPIDRFVQARLEAAGLTAGPAADRRTLIRRVYFDLVGLPPAADEVEAFVGDKSPDAYQKVIDRLLASPHYGERWGRHWLDVARYADTKDLVLLYGKDAIRPDAYAYRDYVIRAFNADVPYDRFIHEQLAADKLYPAEAEAAADADDRWRLAAMGFLTLGRLFDKNPHDIYDDQIDTVTRGLLGLTVSCARCHDHKYDAIPTTDYYALYGVFASSEPPLERPLIADPPDTPEQTEFAAKVAAERQKLADLIDREHAEILKESCLRTGDYLAKIATEKPDPLEDAVFYLSLSPGDLKPPMLSRWRRFLEKRATAGDPVFGPWADLMAVLPRRHGDAEQTGGEQGEAAGSESTAEIGRIVQKWLRVPAGTERGQINGLVREALADATITDRGDVARLYGDVFQRVYEQSHRDPVVSVGAGSGATRASGSAGGDVSSSAARQLLEILTSPDGPVAFPKRSTYLYMTRVPRGEYDSLLLSLDKLAVYFDDAPPRAMVLVDSPEPLDPRVFVRGNPAQPGEPVPRRFLQILAGNEPQPFADGSGRLELAQAITAADNPLTARVMANRIWLHHFGRAIVETPSDFGTRSDPPSHPELLDWLAGEFRGQDSGGRGQGADDAKANIEHSTSNIAPRTATDHLPASHHWSIKRLHRHILLSAAYRQSSFDRPDCRQVDPENRLLWRFSRRRLDLESMRDSLLATSGRLDRRLYGRPVDVAGDPQNARRTIYGLVDRQDLPGLYRAFDFASPDQSAAGRPNTIVPQQALFAMNSAFLVAQARALAHRADKAAAGGAHDRITALYRIALGRNPTADETAQAEAFLEGDGGSATDTDPGLSRWEQLAQVLLLTNEFLFVD